jgi:nucleoid DNA-binding protein
MPTVTKLELSGILARDLGIPRAQAHQALDALFTGLREAVQQGSRIEIRGFGTWTVKTTNAKPNARNPRTGEVVVVPPRRKVKFRPGRIIRDALSQPVEATARQ